jgi:hypothetical protein
MLHNFILNLILVFLVDAYKSDHLYIYGFHSILGKLPGHVLYVTLSKNTTNNLSVDLMLLLSYVLVKWAGTAVT